MSHNRDTGRTYRSGAQKRKEAERKECSEKEFLKKIPKLTSFFKTKDSDDLEQFRQITSTVHVHAACKLHLHCILCTM